MKIAGAGGSFEAVATRRTNARNRSETWVLHSFDNQKKLGETCAVSPHGLPALDWECTAISYSTTSDIVSPTLPEPRRNVGKRHSCW
jgi:hypothetical protein